MNEDMFLCENYKILNAEAEWGYAREPVIAPMPDGSLICTFLSGGQGEPDNKNVTLVVRSYDEGKTWTNPSVLFYHRSRGAYTTEIFTSGSRPILFVHTYDGNSRYREICTFMSTTNDCGKNWSSPVSLPGPSAHVNTRQGIVLSNGLWLFPVYWQEVANKWDWEQTDASNDINMNWPSCCGVLISKDKGCSFQNYGYIKSDMYPLMENTCVELGDGHIVMLMRADKHKFLFRSDSYDYGHTWTQAKPCNIPSASSKVELKSYKDKILLIHNACQTDMFDKRIDLSIWVSGDGMKTWVKKITLVKDHVVMFYPHVIIDPSGLMYIACENSKEGYCLKIDLNKILS